MDAVIAPDGSKVFPLLRVDGGSLARFELPEGRTSRAVAHRTVEELWYIVGGHGEMWQKAGDREQVISLEAGASLSILKGTHFQFRSSGPGPLTAVAVTMPPWPGADEAFFVPGKWTENP